MILVENNWETVKDLHDVSRIIREYYNSNLADEMDKVIKQTTQKFSDEDCYCIKNEFDEIQGRVESLKEMILEVFEEFE